MKKMLKNQKHYLSVILILGILFWSPASGFASEATTGDYLIGIGTKFLRGLENVVTSPAEIPCTMKFDMEDQGSSGLLTGFGKGIVFMLRRILVGVTEIGTFIIPMERTIPTVCTAP